MATQTKAGAVPPAPAAVAEPPPTIGKLADSKDWSRAFRLVLREVAGQKEPLLVHSKDLSAFAARLQTGLDQSRVEELWYAAPKMRDGSLDIDALAAQVVSTPMPGEGAVDSMSDEHYAILMGRLQKMLERNGLGTAKDALAKYCTKPDGSLTPQELDNALANLLPTAVPAFAEYERKLLVGRIGTNKEGRVSVAELQTAITHAHVLALGSWAADVCAHVARLLHQSGASAEDVFQRLSRGGPTMQWTDFRVFFMQLDASLTDRRLQRLWQSFDKDKVGNVSSEEFKRALGTTEAAVRGSTPARVAEARARVVSALRRKGGSIDDVFASLAKGGSSVRWPEFRALLAQIEPSLPEHELLSFWQTFDVDRDGGVSREDFGRSLLPAYAAAQAVSMSEASDIICRLRAALLRMGMSVDQLFDKLSSGGPQVKWPKFRALLLDMEFSLSEDHLQRIWYAFDANSDGAVSRGEFRRVFEAIDGAAPPAGALDVCAQIATTLQRRKMTSRSLFQRLSGAGQQVMWHDFQRWLLQFDTGLTEPAVERLWQAIDKNSDGTLSCEDFVGILLLPEAAAHAAAASDAGDILARVTALIRRRGMSEDQLFDEVSRSMGKVHWPEFRDFTRQLDATLTEEALERLWRTLDKDSDGGVAREAFRRAMAPGVASVALLASRIGRAIVAGKLSLRNRFAPYDAAGEGGMNLGQWMEACRKLQLPLSKVEAVALHEGLVRGSTDRMPLESLDMEVSRASAHSMPEELVARELVCTRARLAQQRGSSLEEVFVSMGDAVEEGVVYAALSQYAPLPDVQWIRLRLLLDRRFEDGLVLWRSFLQWANPAGAVSQPAPAASAASASAAPTGKAAPEAPPAATASAPKAKAPAESAAKAPPADTAKASPPPPSKSAAQAKAPPLETVAVSPKPAPSTGPAASPAAPASAPSAPSPPKSGAVTQPTASAPKPAGTPPSPAPAPPPAATAAPAAAPAASAAAPADPAAPLSPAGMLAEAVLSAMAEVVKLRGCDVQKDILGLDGASAGRLSRPTFTDAMRLYNPTVADEVVDALWGHLSVGDPRAVPVDELVARLTQAVRRTQANPDMTLAWAALGRVRPAFHKQGLRVRAAFERLTVGAATLTCEQLGKGLLGVGCALSEPELEALFALMACSRHQATPLVVREVKLEEFDAAFRDTGPGLDVYGRQVIEDMGVQLLQRASGSLSKAFLQVDVTRDGEIGKLSFGAALRLYGDRNLTDQQVDRIWQLACEIAGPQAVSINFDAFKRVFSASAAKIAAEADAGAVEAVFATPQSRPVASLEESCDHFDRLGRVAELKQVLTQLGDDYVSRAALALALQKVASELTGGEVQQLCRLAPRIGGPLGVEDRHRWTDLVDRFESGCRDWHPVPATLRAEAYDVCRWVHSNLAASGQTLAQKVMDLLAPNFSASTTGQIPREVPPQVVLGALSPFLQRDSERHVAEKSLLLLGRPLEGGRIDFPEFSQRFELLATLGPGTVPARGGAAGPAVSPCFGHASPAGGVAASLAAAAAGMPPAGMVPPTPSSMAFPGSPLAHSVFGSTGGTLPAPPRAVAREQVKEPVDVRSADVVHILRRDHPNGTVLFSTLAHILDSAKLLPRRASADDALRRWLPAAGENRFWWPPLLAFAVTIDRVVVTASKQIRALYQQLQTRVSFCGETVGFRAMTWQFGLMALSEPRTMSMQPRWHALFPLDGPYRIPQEDLVSAVSGRPPPPEHRLRIQMFGLRVDTNVEEMLGETALCVGEDIPAADLRSGAPGSERTIECHPPASFGAGAPEGRLTVKVSLYTRRANRIFEDVAGGVG